MHQLVLADSTSLASILAATFSGVATVILALLHWRAQSYKQLLEDLTDLLRSEREVNLKATKRAIRDALARPGGRRWYDEDHPDEHD